MTLDRPGTMSMNLVFVFLGEDSWSVMTDGSAVDDLWSISEFLTLYALGSEQERLRHQEKRSSPQYRRLLRDTEQKAW